VIAGATPSPKDKLILPVLEDTLLANRNTKGVTGRKG